MATQYRIEKKENENENDKVNQDFSRRNIDKIFKKIKIKNKLAK